jgi:hypothetical protein
MDKQKQKGKQYKDNNKKEKAKYLSYKIEHLHKQGAREKSIAEDYGRSNLKDKKLLQDAALEKVKEIEDRTQKALMQYRKLVN